ncbi:MAG: C4-dicarboxylate ABC transporter permease [Alphaproteobacteria bacterium]|nr:MAG: C4-dicarboxylate ABC transporter permease [Alphaproteobacteria bacterium]
MTEPIFLGISSLFVLIFLIIIRIPIAYAMILTGGIGIMSIDGVGTIFNQLKTLAYGQFSNYDLSVVPLFILMGALASRIGLSSALFAAANSWLSWLRGGSAMAAISACAGFGAICGSSIATASTMGRVALPELLKFNYSISLATGVLAAGGVLGILIPPSIVLIIYALIVEVNIVSMFAAALIPGLLAMCLFLATIAIFVAIYPDAAPKTRKTDKEERIRATIGILPVASVFIIVLGGMYAGFFNPTPAASLGVGLVLIIGYVTKKLNLTQLKEALLETAGLSGMIYLILLGAELMKIYMSRTGLPQALADWILVAGFEPMSVIIVLLLGMILLGCLLDSLSIILLIIPFFWPVLVELNGGVHIAAETAGFGMTTGDLKIWFGILALVVVEVGLITPPVGMNVFVISSIADNCDISDTFKGVSPFFIAELIRIVILVSLPILALWLPNILTG